MRSALTLLTLAGTTVAALSGVHPMAGSRLWGSLRPGSQAVGFATRLELDDTRTERGSARPVQTGCWYPAATGGVAMTFADYFSLSTQEHGEPASVAAQRAAVGDLKRRVAGAGIPEAAIDEWLPATMSARHDAPAADGTHRLVLIAQGNGHSIYNQSVLGEFLASHGYVVCTSPSQSRLSPPMQSEDDVLPHARAQAADLRVVERSARARFRVDGDPGVVAHSFGARSALLFAASAPASGIVSLDGGIGAAAARGWLDPASAAGRETLTRVRVPLLHLFETTDPEMAPDFALLASMPVRPIAIRVDGLHHWDFSVLGASSAAIPALRGEPPPPDLDARLAAIAELTLAFLDEHVRKDPAAAGRFASVRGPWLRRVSVRAGPGSERRQ